MFSKEELNGMRKIVVSDFVINANYGTMVERLTSISGFDVIERPITFLSTSDLAILSLRAQGWVFVRCADVGECYRFGKTTFLVREHEVHGTMMLMIGPLGMIETGGRNNYPHALSEKKIAYFYGSSDAVDEVRHLLAKFAAPYPRLEFSCNYGEPLDIVIKVINPVIVRLNLNDDGVESFMAYSDIMGTHRHMGDSNYCRKPDHIIHCDKDFNFTFLSEKLSIVELQQKVADVRQACIDKFKQK